MKYYIESIEQIRQEGTLAEYGKTERVNDENSALSKYYKALSDVANDLGKNHTYMHIKIVNSYGVVIKSDVIGSYVEETVEGE